MTRPSAAGEPSDFDQAPAAVLWDMDGTLLDSEKLWSTALNDYAAHLGEELSARVRAELVGSNMIRSMTLVLDDLQRPTDSVSVDAASRWVESRTAELFRDGLPWRPGAREALRAVRAAGARTALVTSTIRSLTEIALETLGRENFDTTVCGDEVAASKPDPAPYRQAAEQLGVDPRRCVAVEDSPTGARAAAAAGCAVLVVPCEVPVAPEERFVVRESLEGVDHSLLCGLTARVAA